MKRLAPVAALAVTLASRLAAADAAVDQCVDAADHAQQSRDAGKLSVARQELLVCSDAACPGPVAKQCAKWLHQVDEEMPTVSLRVRDANGKDAFDVSILVDDQPLAVGLDGRAVPMDPGPHHLVFRRAGSPDVEESIVTRVGEKNRLVDVQLRESSPLTESHKPLIAQPPPQPESSGFRFPAATWLPLGLGVAGFATMGVLVGVASSDASQLRSTCAPLCNPSDVDAVQTKLTLANVALGVGVVGLVVTATALVVANVGRHPRATASLALP